MPFLLADWEYYDDILILMHVQVDKESPKTGASCKELEKYSQDHKATTETSRTLSHLLPYLWSLSSNQVSIVIAQYQLAMNISQLKLIVYSIVDLLQMQLIFTLSGFHGRYEHLQCQVYWHIFYVQYCSIHKSTNDEAVMCF